MSYILDALKRAEQERTSSLAGAPDAAVARGPRTRLRPLTLAMAGATIFLAGIGVAALLFRPSGHGPAGATSLPEVAAAPASATPAPVAVPAAQMPQQSGAIEATAPADMPIVDEFESLDDIAPVFQGTPVVDAAAPGASPSAPAMPAPVNAAPANAALASASPAATATQAPTLLLPPLLDDMPAEFRARFPQLQLQVHVHDADPAGRWVMIDNRRYAEGSHLPTGPRVAEITADGVIFDLDGQRTYWPLTR